MALTSRTRLEDVRGLTNATAPHKARAASSTATPRMPTARMPAVQARHFQPTKARTTKTATRPTTTTRIAPPSPAIRAMPSLPASRVKRTKGHKTPAGVAAIPRLPQVHSLQGTLLDAPTPSTPTTSRRVRPLLGVPPLQRDLPLVPLCLQRLSPIPHSPCVKKNPNPPKKRKNCPSSRSPSWISEAPTNEPIDACKPLLPAFS